MEYTFLLKIAAKTGRQVWPLGGKAELMGDTIYSLDKMGWGLFEFKRDRASLKTEIAKFAVDTEEYAQALLAVRSLKRGLAAMKAALTTHHVSPTSNAGVQDVEEPELRAEKLAIQACEAAYVNLEDIQCAAFGRAQVFFEKQFSGPTYHFLVYGRKVKNKAAITLYIRQYFDLLKELRAPDAVDNDAMDALVKWDKASFAKYLGEFMNFKRFGVAIADGRGSGGSGDTDGIVGETVRDGGDKAADSSEAGGAVPSDSGGKSGSLETKAWQLSDISVGDYPTYIIGVDEARIIVAPLDKSVATLRLLNYMSSSEPALILADSPAQKGTRIRRTG